MLVNFQSATGMSLAGDETEVVAGTSREGLDRYIFRGLSGSKHLLPQPLVGGARSRWRE
jgi:hypothetical protein